MNEREQRHKRTMNWLYWAGTIITVLPFLGIVAFFASILYPFRLMNDRAVVPLRTMAEVKQRVKIPFPAETELLHGKVMFGLGGGKLAMRAKMPRKELAHFLVQCARWQQARETIGTQLPKLPTMAKATAELERAAAAPGRKLTEDELDLLNLNLLFPTEKEPSAAKEWRTDQIQRAYRAEALWNGINGLDITVNLDDPDRPIIYLVYDYI